MKNKLIRFTMGTLLCFAMLCSTALADTGDIPSPFPDVSSSADYLQAVRRLYEMGVFGGDEHGNFNPNNTITRAECAKVMCQLAGVGDEAAKITKQTFPDVPSSHWAVGYVAKASELGIINGYDGKFWPSDPITYEQIITMLVRTWGYDDLATENGGYPSGYLLAGQRLGITSDVSVKQGEGAPRKDVAMLCYNILFVAPSDFSI